MSIEATTLGIECDGDGATKVTCWVRCRSGSDIDDVILWLGLAREVSEQWKEITARRRAELTAGGKVTPINKGKER